MKRSKLNIFDYTDFRCFLRDRLGEMKEQDKKYSLRYLSNKMGLASKSHLKMVADGARNLSPELAEQMASVFGLNEQETGFFLVLIRFGQAKSLSEQQDALAELRKRRRFLAVHQLKLDRFDYLSDPLTLALREMVTFADFQENPDWIQKRLPKKFSKTKILEAIDKLLRIGLLFRQQDGSLAVAQKHQHTGDDFRSTALKLFYQNAFRQAAQSLTQPADEAALRRVDHGDFQRFIREDCGSLQRVHHRCSQHCR